MAQQAGKTNCAVTIRSHTDSRHGAGVVMVLRSRPIMLSRPTSQVPNEAADICIFLF